MRELCGLFSQLQLCRRPAVCWLKQHQSRKNTTKTQLDNWHQGVSLSDYTLCIQGCRSTAQSAGVLRSTRRSVCVIWFLHLVVIKLQTAYLMSFETYSRNAWWRNPPLLWIDFHTIVIFKVSTNVFFVFSLLETDWNDPLVSFESDDEKDWRYKTKTLLASVEKALFCNVLCVMCMDVRSLRCRRI